VLESHHNQTHWKCFINVWFSW